MIQLECKINDEIHQNLIFMFNNVNDKDALVSLIAIVIVIFMALLMYIITFNICHRRCVLHIR